jgi:hypothetical protein
MKHSQESLSLPISMSNYDSSSYIDNIRKTQPFAYATYLTLAIMRKKIGVVIPSLNFLLIPFFLQASLNCFETNSRLLSVLKSFSLVPV